MVGLDYPECRDAKPDSSTYAQPGPSRLKDSVDRRQPKVQSSTQQHHSFFLLNVTLFWSRSKVSRAATQSLMAP